MKTLPILPNIYNPNIYPDIKVRYNTSSIQFCGGPVAPNTEENIDHIGQVNMEDIMKNSSDLHTKFIKALASEKEMHKKVDSMLSNLTDRMSTILTENGFHPEIFNTKSQRTENQESEVRRFFELMKENRRDTVKEPTHIQNVDRWAKAQLINNPENVAAQTEQRLILKSKKYPQSALVIYAYSKEGYSDRPTKNYILGIDSYKDDEYQLQNNNRKKRSNYPDVLVLQNNPDVELSCMFRDFEFRLFNDLPIVDKKNNIKYEYCHNSRKVCGITLLDENASIDVMYNKRIIQTFPDKVVVHQLSDDMSKTRYISFYTPEEGKTI